MIKTQYNTTVYHLHSDNSCEYVSNEFRSELAKQSILRKFTCPYLPEQNGFIERKNRSLMSIVRCLFHGMNVPKYFWHIFAQNLTPSQSLQVKTPLRYYDSSS